MSVIRTITIEGFKSFKALRDLPLRSLNVLIGANGSGKSNFLEALELMTLCACRPQRIDEYVKRAGGANRLLHFGTKATAQIRFEAKFKDDQGDFSIIMRPDVEDRLFPLFSAGGSDLLREIELKPNKTWLLGILQDRLADLETLHFHDTSPRSPIKTDADLHDNRRLRRDGSNLAPFLYLLRKKYATSYDMIRSTVRLAAPFLEDFALKPLALNEDKIRLEWRHVRSDAYFDASSLSDGSLRFIALATALLQPPPLRPAVMLLDEPELGLHPYAITLLASLLRRASEDSQIIVATQSPVLLDHFEPEDVLVAERVVGATTLRRLDSERLGDWLEDYSLGQLWEKNELGGRPAPRAG
ncbi:MAG: AAA family ATPase [Gemmatimonadetes bacterium]|nr:AAA family ATPase [Gemmatimonadota bacterium]